MASALILLAHGARDPRWAAPFERVLARVQARSPQCAPMLAFLDLMEPDLATAIGAQFARGFTAVRVVPLFLGQGGHLRDDVPRLIDAIRAAHPGSNIELAGAAGDDEGVVEALAEYCLHHAKA